MTSPAQTARIAEVSRHTAETRISVKINLDGTGQSRLATGIGFFDPDAGFGGVAAHLGDAGAGLGWGGHRLC